MTNLVYFLEFYRTDNPTKKKIVSYKTFNRAVHQLERLVDEGYSGTIYEASPRMGWYHEDELEEIEQATT